MKNISCLKEDSVIVHGDFRFNGRSLHRTYSGTSCGRGSDGVFLGGVASDSGRLAPTAVKHIHVESLPERFVDIFPTYLQSIVSRMSDSAFPSTR